MRIPYLPWDPNNARSKAHRIKKKMLKIARSKPFDLIKIQEAYKKIIDNWFCKPIKPFKNEWFFAKSSGWFWIDSGIIWGDKTALYISPRWLCA